MVLDIKENKSKSTIYVPDIATIKKVEQLSPIEKLFTIVFDDPKKQEEFSFEPGQFVELTVFGLGEAPFSIPSSPNNKKCFQLCVRDIGSVSGALHRMDAGSKIGIRGPFGKGYFPYDKMRNHNVLIVAGGLGLAPVMSFIDYILEDRKNYKELNLVYGALDPESIIFKDRVKEFEKRKDINIHLTVDNADASWKGNVGVVTKLIPAIECVPEETFAVVCGPPVMYKFVVKELEKKNLKPENIYLSLERRMECGVGKCNHCHIGDKLACVDGPVFSLWEIRNLKEAI